MTNSNLYPDKMLAVFPGEQGDPLIVREVSIPKPGPNEVLIRMSAAPVNPSDIAMIKKVQKDQDLNLFIPGLEGSGKVVAAGKGFLPWILMGKRVACSAVSPTSGTWAEYMVTKAGMCFPLDRKVTDEQGSMSLVNPLTALEFIEIAKKRRHKAIINNAAAGALGRMIELLGKKHGIPVINIVRTQKHVETLKDLGSGFVLDSSDPLFIDNLKLLSKELQATLLFDSVCSRQLQKMVDVLPPDSFVIIYGNLSGEENIMINPRSLIDNNISISGFYLGNRTKENGIFKNMINLRKVSRLMSTDLKIKIQGRFTLTKVNEALEAYQKNMSEGKVILIPGRE
jgi:NADPH:quinone reductase